MPGYWNAHSDRDWQDRNSEPPTDEDWLELRIEDLQINIRALKNTIVAQLADLAAAEKWAREYQAKHGDFEPDPALPAFMNIPDTKLPF